MFPLVIPGSYALFVDMLTAARNSSELIRDMTTDPAELPTDAEYFITYDGLSGFLIHNGELCGLFSRASGRGQYLVTQAIRNGATHLDCFDGYLPTLYSGLGFTEIRREKNWTKGNPDVVYMSR